MYQIDIANKQRCLKLTASYVRKVVRQTLKVEEVAEANISVAIVDDAAIHDVNRQFLKHDYPTDVISFLFKESGGSVDIGGGIRVLEPGQPKLPRGARKTLEGEVIVSAETAVWMAEAIGWSATEELTLYLVHGVLHLCGYDDLKKRELKLMRARERAVMESLGLTIPPREDELATENRNKEKTAAARKKAAVKKATVKKATGKAKGTTS